METVIGQVQGFAFDYEPEGWHFCNGQLLDVRQYMVLFSLLGINYGGNGSTNFALPNIPKSKEGLTYCICSSGGQYPRRK